MLDRGDPSFSVLLPRSGFVPKPRVASTLGTRLNLISTPTGFRPRILVNRVVHADETALRLKSLYASSPRVAEAATLGSGTEPLRGMRSHSMETDAVVTRSNFWNVNLLGHCAGRL
jgi:hypothetical protein